ncbi:Pkinase-domain-containing protein [Piedraia hortae CBS 480.64]|uniref:non-specific serine/threonine protein kinase n=1 Tax=Piedraia hortae CBS 480.64 TaxID=1314780 RepID=A0A6A7CAC6_9PEZI|nr:Pkinase-domain-containing protein [Piedraia hortae CBS 480.64]
MGAPPGSPQVPLPSNIPFRIISKTIGSGTYASVRKACPPHVSHPVIAVKFINKDHAYKAGRLRPKQLKIELSLHNHVTGHPNIIRFLAAGEDEHWVWMGMELAEGGDLFDKIEADEGCSLDVAHLYFVQLVRAMAYCHDKGVAHRDVKPENILLSKDGDLKLADFGLATQFALPGRNDNIKKCSMVCGSPPYIAPEILEIGEVNRKRKNRGEDTPVGYMPNRADVWSCAIVLFVLLAGNTPWDSPNPAESYEYHDYLSSGVGRPQDELWQKVPSDVVGLLRGMLNPDPEKRLTLSEVMKLPWFCRNNEQLGPDGMVANPVKLATHMLEGLRIDFDAAVTASQAAAGPTPGTETPVNESMSWEWEEPPRSSSVMLKSSTPPAPSQNITTADILDAVSEDPSQSQITRIPVTQMTATQQARAFNDIVPSYSLTRFYSHYTCEALVPLVLSALQTLNVSILAEEQNGPDKFSIQIKALDPRRELLRGRVVVERVQIRGHSMSVLEVVEVRFIKAKGDPLGWRRLFKSVAVHCKEAIPRRS